MFESDNAMSSPERHGSEENSPSWESSETDPFLVKIHKKLVHSNIGYSNKVPPYILEELVIFLKSVIRAMSEYKRMYRITCPVLTGGKIYDQDASIISEVVYYRRGQFTLEDLQNILKEKKHLIPHEQTYILLMDEIAKRRYRKKEQKLE